MKGREAADELELSRREVIGERDLAAAKSGRDSCRKTKTRNNFCWLSKIITIFSSLFLVIHGMGKISLSMNRYVHVIM